MQQAGPTTQRAEVVTSHQRGQICVTILDQLKACVSMRVKQKLYSVREGGGLIRSEAKVHLQRDKITLRPLRTREAAEVMFAGSKNGLRRCHGSTIAQMSVPLVLLPAESFNGQATENMSAGILCGLQQNIIQTSAGK